MVVTHDNDFFAQDTDRDYTGGIQFSFPGARNARAARIGFRALELGDTMFRSAQCCSASNGPSSSLVRVGLLVFTPDDIGNHEPIYSDRPYANLAYAEFSKFSTRQSGQTISYSSLTIGLLGTGIAEALQKAIHRSRDLTIPNGFGHQISDGGELAARYAWGRYRNIFTRASHDLTFGYQASIGYTTDATAGLNLRFGRRVSSWATTLSDFSDRASRASPVIRARSGENGDYYISAGIGLRLQAYNAFLQGQWRGSEVTVSASNLNRLLLEAWVGMTSQFRNLRVEYKVRFRSAEIKHGPHARNQLWGSLTVQRAF
jgi:hypothetical protein